jgi:APA family basic amino acid/polyamine antiporter
MSGLTHAPTDRGAPGTAALLATGCGTAIASVCAVGLFQIERLLGGLWSVAAVLTAGGCCLLLARALARLSAALPTGAGLLAYLSRGLGRRAGIAAVLPYLLLTLFLAGAEAMVVGLLCARLLPVPAAAGSLAFLLGTWALCSAGVRVSYRVQAAATWALVGGLGVASLAALAGAWQRGEMSDRLLPDVPGLGHFVAGVGQALFLFMGFELVTCQAEVAATPRAVGRALVGSVGVLAAFYGLVSLGFSCLPETAAAEHALVPQLAVADQAAGRLALVPIAVLSVLASFTSFHGALLALSRFTCALAAQGLLPRGLARVEARKLVPRNALTTLLALAIGATALVGLGGVLRAALLAAAVAASLVYAGVPWVRERPPFTEGGRGRGLRLMSGALSAGLVALGIGVLADAGPLLLGTLALLAATFAGAALVAALASRRVRRGREVGPYVA